MPGPEAKRVVSRVEVLALSLNDVIGSGVYLLPAAAPAIAVPLLVLTAIDVRGVKEGARTAAFLLVAKLVPLAVFVGAGLFAVKWSRVAAPARVDPAGLGEVALLLGYGPAFLARLHPRTLTPAAAIVVQTAVVLPLALTGSFAGLATLSVVARLASYISTAAAIPALRKKLSDTPTTVRLPFGPAIPIAAVVVSAFLVASATAPDLVAGTGALVAGLAVYALRRKAATGGGEPAP